MKQFKCNQCSHQFEADGVKKEYASPVYGPCFKWVAVCPECTAESDEYHKPSGKRIAAAVSGAPSCGCNGCCGRN